MDINKFNIIICFSQMLYYIYIQDVLSNTHYNTQQLRKSLKKKLICGFIWQIICFIYILLMVPSESKMSMIFILIGASGALFIGLIEYSYPQFFNNLNVRTISIKCKPA